MALIKREILTSRRVLCMKSCTRNKFLFCKSCFPKYGFLSLKIQVPEKNIDIPVACL